MKHAPPEPEPVPRPADGAQAPQGLELRHLRYFAAVADAGSCTHAAEQLFIAQPALSQQIRRLEQIAGTPLLHRRRDGLRLTAAGGVLLDASRNVLSLIDYEVSRTRQAAGPGQPRLRMVIPPGLPADLAVKTTAALRAAATSLANTQSRAELSASRARIAAAADETRRRLERDLHDGIQQRLVSLGLKARMIQTMTPRPADTIQRELSLLADGLFTALDELREISHGIHPAVLSEAGLGPALKALARRSAVPVDLDLNIGSPLGQRVEVAAYYIASEALANAAKHAQGSVIDLRVHGDDSALTLSISDDGIGGADPSRGTGITGLKDRVEALGGTISVLSPPGHGTTLHVRLPAGASAVARADGGCREDTVTDAGGYPAARERRLSSGLPVATAPRGHARIFEGPSAASCATGRIQASGRIPGRHAGQPRPPGASITEPEVAASASSSCSAPWTDPRSPIPSPGTATDDPIRTSST
jgi:signal transduction histidine kinase